MAALRNIERTLETLRRMDPEHAKEITRAIGARGNVQPKRDAQRPLRNKRSRK